MHGVRRREKTSEEIEQDRRKKELEKVNAFKDLSSQIYKLRDESVHDKTALHLTSKLLAMNGEVYTVWNYRRRILASLFEELKENKEELEKLISEELKFIQGAISQNPKSYWAFNQRIWVTSQYPQCNWEKEIGLCDMLLKADERNFHCWDYRRFCSRQSGRTLKDEFEFTTKKVEDNFSNYSAWHQRSVLLPLLFKDDPEGLQSALKEEFDLVKNAFYTEPNDQSAWFYHRWLRFQTCGTSRTNRSKEQNQILQNELKDLKILYQEEPNAKWVIFTIAQVLLEIGDSNDHEEVQQLLQKLIQIDPDHTQYYCDLLEK